MRRIFSFHVTTVDGYYEGPDHEFDWPIVDDEFNQFALAQLDEVDTLMFGRITYEMMAGYWPSPAAGADDPKIAERMNTLPKLVVSRTMQRADWTNTRIVGGHVAAELRTLKEQQGKDIVVMGSSDLTVNLIHQGLLDEVRIMLTPVVLGDGKSLFRTAPGRISLQLVQSKPFDSGNVLLHYQPSVAG